MESHPHLLGSCPSLSAVTSSGLSHPCFHPSCHVFTCACIPGPGRVEGQGCSVSDLRKLPATALWILFHAEEPGEGHVGGAVSTACRPLSQDRPSWERDSWPVEVGPCPSSEMLLRFTSSWNLPRILPHPTWARSSLLCPQSSACFGHSIVCRHWSLTLCPWMSYLMVLASVFQL